MDDLLETIERALKAQGVSARQVSLEAAGTPGVVRMMRQGHAPSVERVRALCRVLGLEFYVGPPREGDVQGGPITPRPLTSFTSSVVLPVRHWAQCLSEGYLIPEERDPDLAPPRSDLAPAPEGLVDRHAFYAREPGHSMVPAGLEAGNYCLISPCARLGPGDRVWLRDGAGLEAIRWLIDLTATTYELRAWGQPDASTGRQEMLADRWLRKNVVDRGVVLAVYRNRPDVNKPPHRAARWRPDQVMLRWQTELQTAGSAIPFSPPLPPAAAPAAWQSVVKMRKDMEQTLSEILEIAGAQSARTVKASNEADPPR